jgi:hypothetical protein
MRPNQHNKRSRGRSRHRGSSGGGGGGGNPLSRVYESNGPDVKVRGTAQTIAEKYLQLGRDAQASGDNVMSESYFQHAEHYLRILAAAQAYNQQMQQQHRRPGEEYEDDEGDDSGEGDSEDMAASSAESNDQPMISGVYGADAEERQPQQQQREFRPRDRDRDRDRDRHSGRPRHDQRRDQQEQPREQPPQMSVAEEQPVAENASPAGSAGDAGWEAPSFLRKPSSNGTGRPRYERRPRKESAEPTEAQASEPVTADAPQGE